MRRDRSGTGPGRPAPTLTADDRPLRRCRGRARAEHSAAAAAASARARSTSWSGQRHVLAERSALRLAIEADRPPSMILYGPPGVGKTTLARIVAERTGAAFEELSAVSARVDDVRGVLQRARDRIGANGAQHDPLPRRDPPLQQGPAGRAPARGRERARDADRRDDREPLLRGQRRPHLALRRDRARAADGRGGGGRRRPRRRRARRGGLPRRHRRDRPQGGRRRQERPLDPRARVADRRRRGRGTRAAACRRCGPQAAAPLRPRRRPALRHHLRLHQVDARQ